MAVARASASWARCARSAACSSSSSISGEYAGSAAGPSSAALSAASCCRAKTGWSASGSSKLCTA
eukprot:2604053-Alexandrium_andersonii.AAC.1